MARADLKLIYILLLTVSIGSPLSPISHPPTQTTGQLTTTVSVTTLIHILAKVTHLHSTGRETVLQAEIQIN